MLKSSRDLIIQHQHRHGRRRIYAPRIKWAKWLDTGGEEEEALPTSGRKSNRQGTLNEDVDDEAETGDVDSKENLLDPFQKRDIENTADSHRESPERMIPVNETSKGKLPSPVVIPAWLRIRGCLADSLEWIQESDDVLYAFKLTIAVFLVLWPAFVASWNQWYSLNRGRTFGS